MKENLDNKVVNNLKEIANITTSVVVKSDKNQLNVSFYDWEQKKVKTIKLNNKNWFQIKVNKVIFQKLLAYYRNNLRQPGVHHTKTRSDVRGGGRKPYQQKGTGNARQGSIRSPQYRGGGVVFGPLKTKNYKINVNKKEKNLALKGVLYSKIINNDLKLISALELKNYSTKVFMQIISFLKHNLGQSVLFILENLNNKFILSSLKNVKFVSFTTASKVNLLNLLQNRKVVITKLAFAILEERLFSYA